MPVDQEKCRAALRKLNRQFTRLAHEPSQDDIHRFRTSGRRVEAILSELVAKPSRNDQKLLKLLSRLRKKAGRVRDLDIQISLLRNLKIPEGNAHKSHLLETLVEERTISEKKLAKAYGKKQLTEGRRRLKRAQAGLEIGKAVEPLILTARIMSGLGRDGAPLTEKLLHRYRIAGKRARYVAELAADDPEAKRVVEQLKRMQDVIGDWHDWLKLLQKGEELFADVQDSALLVMLRNVTHAKFRQGADALAELRNGRPSRKPASAARAPGRATKAAAA